MPHDATSYSAVARARDATVCQLAGRKCTIDAPMRDSTYYSS